MSGTALCNGAADMQSQKKGAAKFILNESQRVRNVLS